MLSSPAGTWSNPTGKIEGIGLPPGEACNRPIQKGDFAVRPHGEDVQPRPRENAPERRRRLFCRCGVRMRSSMRMLPSFPIGTFAARFIDGDSILNFWPAPAMGPAFRRRFSAGLHRAPPSARTNCWALPWCCGNQAVVGHYSDKRGFVGWTARVDYGSNVPEILSTDIRRLHDQRSCSRGKRIVEGMNDALGRAHALTCRKISRFRADRVSQRAFENIDALFVVRMAVWGRHIRAGRNR